MLALKCLTMLSPLYSKLNNATKFFLQILNLNHVAIGHTTVGHIINLASNDVHRFEQVCTHNSHTYTHAHTCTVASYFSFSIHQAFMFIHQLWISPLVFVVFVYLLYSELGLCGLVPMQLVIIILPFQFMLSRLFHFVRLELAVPCMTAQQTITTISS